MTRYEDHYGTDWSRLSKDEAIERAYALGVAAAALDEYLPEELERVRNEMTSAYNKSVVDLAFEEGKSEAREYDARSDDDGPPPWAALVEGDADAFEDDTLHTGGQFGLPEAVDRIEALDRPEMDRSAAVDRPGFLERE
jgi:hypothetical protein